MVKEVMRIKNMITNIFFSLDRLRYSSLFCCMESRGTRKENSQFFLLGIKVKEKKLFEYYEVNEVN